jgi:hypothetical protein
MFHTFLSLFIIIVREYSNVPLTSHDNTHHARLDHPPAADHHRT